MSASPLRIPDLGEGVEEGTVVALRVAAGDVVEAEQIVLEIETDKVTVEVPAPRAGVIHALCVTLDDTVRPGDVVLELESNPGAVSDEAACGQSESSEPQPVAVHADRVARSEQHPSGPSPAAPVAVTTSDSRPPAVIPGRIVPAGPAARREARELGIDIASVHGSGPGGRISRSDVRQSVRASLATGPTSQSDVTTTPTLPDLTRYGNVRREPASRVNRATASNLARATSIVPHAWVMRRIDITSLELARRSLRAAQGSDAAPLTLTALLCKAVAILLQEMPRFNAAWDATSTEIVFREYVNVGVAVDTPSGLLVPVLRNLDQTSVLTIADTLSELSVAARDGRLEPADVGGAGITISNLGGLGVEVLQPIVNWPEAAIVGVGSLETTTDAGVQKIRIAVSLGFDHRLINGADAARFLARLDELLGDPLALAIVA